MVQTFYRATPHALIEHRLSENPNTTVGVIETGEYLPDDPLINTPSSAFAIPGNAKYDWLFRSVPQANLNNRAIKLPSKPGLNSETLGGIGMVSLPLWILPNMKAAERFTGVDPFRINYTNADPDDVFPSQGKNGLVAASYNNWYSDIVLPFSKSMANLGIPTNFDPDSGKAYGVFNSATSINRTTGRRSHSGVTYYAYNAHRPNFVVLTGAQATKINFDTNNSAKSGNLVATGVSFVHNSQTYTVKAKNEVILSLSGIGNSTLLKKHGIEVLIDLPTVGENHQDHTLLTTTYELKPGSLSQSYNDLKNNATFAAQAAAQYNASHDGIMSSTPSVISFFNLSPMASSAEIANMTARLEKEIKSEKLTPLQKASYKIQKRWLKEKVGLVEVIVYPGQCYAGVGVPKANTSYMTIFTSVQHPFSRGNVHLNSSDPLAPPQIDPKYFSKSIDLETMVNLVKFSQRLAKTEPLASVVVARQDPAPEVTSDSDIIEYIKANVGSIQHPIGTVALAPKELGGVVDSKLKVYGTANVRVPPVIKAALILVAIESRYGIALSLAGRRGYSVEGPALDSVRKYVSGRSFLDHYDHLTDGFGHRTNKLTHNRRAYIPYENISNTPSQLSGYQKFRNSLYCQQSPAVSWTCRTHGFTSLVHFKEYIPQ
ncbi:GMC oxidoreductase [Rhizoctonia solani AG-1 IA]|uniref:GMC oxidoreductase n=1 Tax=Thanatephorus cucumeris (strain AG1-IA) TaxID=983506 RepID=L8WVK4_THACA|nr:GMC oxidoreductase [Rhizoctonia solani AG-1 IA]